MISSMGRSIKRNIKDNSKVWAVLCLALLLRIILLNYNLPHVVIQRDEENVVVRALRMGWGDLNPHWFLYPSLYIYITFALHGIYYLLGNAWGIFVSAQDFAEAFFSDPTVFYVLPRALSAVLGTATVWLIYRAVMELYGSRPIAILSALFLALATSHVRESHSAKPDAAMIFFMAWAFLYCVRFFRYGIRRDSLFAGFLTGLAISTKYPAGMMILPLILSHFLRPRVRDQFQAGTLSLTLLLVGAGFVLGTPYAVLDWSSFKDWFGWVRGHQEIIWAGQPYPELSGYAYYLIHAWPQSVGWPLVLCGILGMFSLFRFHLKEACLHLAFPIATYLFLGKSSRFASNFFTPCLPFLVVPAAYLVQQLLTALKSRPLIIHILLIASLLAFPITLASKQIYSFSMLDTSLLAKFWIQQNVSDGSRIFSLIDAPPLDLSPERIREILSKVSDDVDITKGFKATYTGRGAYYEYLLRHPRHPSYYYLNLPFPPADIADYTRGLNSEIFNNYHYAIVKRSERDSEVPLVTVHRLRTASERQFLKNLDIFLDLVQARGQVIQSIDSNTQWTDVEGIRLLLFSIWGRPGSTFDIYRLSGVREQSASQ